jgi:integrase
MPEQYRAFVVLAAWGTLRRGEVLGLRRKDIDVIAGSVWVERALHDYHDGSLEIGATKNGDPRRVHLPSGVMPSIVDHLERFVGDAPDSPMFVGATGEPLRPSNFWVIWEAARKTVGLKPVRFHDLRHFAATMFASPGASTKEIMSRGGWRSVTMVVRYEHALEERDALLADPLNPYIQTGIVVPIGLLHRKDRARSAHEGDGSTSNEEGSPPLTRKNDAESSGGETRTLNLAVNSRLLCH